LRTAISTSLLLACLACKDTPAEGSSGERQGVDQQQTIREPTLAGEAKKLVPYFEIGEQLAADRVDGIDLLGRAVIGSTTLERTDPNVARIHAGAEALATTDLEAARAAYRDISHALLDYLDAHPEAREGLYLMHCPMTFDDQGAYWVARTDEIHNPYEGSRMLTCGLVLGWDEGVEHRKKWAAAQAPSTP
jgi:hypothetical protein